MGFLGKILGKKPEPEQKPLSVEEAIELAQKKLNDTDFTRGAEICNATKAAIEGTKTSLKVLDKAVLDPQYHKKLKAAATESKKQLILKINKDLSLVQLPSDHTYDGLLRTQKTLADRLASISQGNKKHGYYTALAFRNETLKLNKNLSELSRLSNDLKLYLDSVASQNKPYKELLDAKTQKESLTKEIAMLKDKIKQKGAEKEKLEKQKQELEKKLGNFAELNAKQTTVSSLEKDLSEIHSKIHNLIAPLSRIFRKYKKIGMFEKPIGGTLQNYIDNPADAAVADTDGHLAEILIGTEKMTKSGEFGLDEKEQRKTLRTITSIREGVPKLINDYEDLNVKLKGEKSGAATLSDKKQGVDVQLKDLTFKFNTVNNEVSGFEKTLAAKEQELASVEESLKNKAMLLR